MLSVVNLTKSGMETSENSVHFSDNLGNTPLLIAAFNDSIQTIELLLEFGVEKIDLAAIKNYMKYYWHLVQIQILRTQIIESLMI